MNSSATTSEEAIRGSDRTREIDLPLPTACAVYKYLPDEDVFRCVSCSGSEGHLLQGLAIKRRAGDGLGGGEHRTVTISQAELDLQALAFFFQSAAATSDLCAVLESKDRLLGVLSGYAAKDNAFLTHIGTRSSGWHHCSESD